MLQIGTVWLPLPHLLMAPLTANDWLWRTGLAGTVVGIPSLALAAVAVFLLLRDAGRLPAAVGTAIFATNPNLLYLAATPMTEVLSLCTTLWAVYLALHSKRPLLAGFIATLACLTRYEAWFLLPFLAIVMWRRLGLRAALVFSLAAGTGPAWWLAHNWWFYGDALEFYRGEYSAKAIYARQLAAGVPRYPAEGDWLNSARYYVRAAWLTIGAPLLLTGALGWIARGREWKTLGLLLAAPAAFFIWSLHSAGTQIYVPGLWPDSTFNTRYALAALPLVAVGSGLLAKQTRWLAIAVAVLALVPWLQPAIVRSEASELSYERREWTARAAPYVAANYRGGGIALSFGDLTGVLQQAGIPLKETLHDGDRLRWEAALARPDLFLKEQWALCFEDDTLSRAVRRSGRYHLARRFNKAELWVRGSEPWPITAVDLAAHP